MADPVFDNIKQDLIVKINELNKFMPDKADKIRKVMLELLDLTKSRLYYGLNMDMGYHTARYRGEDFLDEYVLYKFAQSLDVDASRLDTVPEPLKDQLKHCYRRLLTA